MCIAIHKPKGVSLPKNVLKACFAKNGDGAGMAYVKNGKLIINKGFFSEKATIKAIREHEAEEMIIHFRVASPGMVINKDNCHPFRIRSTNGGNWSFAVIHNGRLPWKNTNLKSDTSCFTDEMLKPILERDPWFLDQEYGTLLMEDFIGLNNKMVVMRLNEDTQESTVYILNEDQGTQAFGCWMSNYSYMPSWQQGGAIGMYGGDGMSDDYDDYDDYDDREVFGANVSRGNAVHVGKKVDDEERDPNVYGEYYLDPMTKQWALVGSDEYKAMKAAKEAADKAAEDATKAKGEVIDITTGQDKEDDNSEAMGQEADKKIENEEWSGISDRMEYFTPDQRRQMRAICAPYLKSQGIDLKGVGTADLVELAIDDLRYYMEEIKKMNDEEARRWALIHGEDAFERIMEGLKLGTV